MARTYKTYNRYYVAILYRDDENFNKYFENINKYYTEVTYIIHDKDYKYIKDENGKLVREEKKEHMHILFKVGKNARGINSVAEEIEIPINYIEGCNKDNMLLYFIHYKKKDKVKYSVNDVEGELKEYLRTLLSEQKNESEILEDILFLIGSKKIRTNMALMQYCIRINRVDIMRKYSFIINNILKEENKVDKEEKKE